MTHTAPGNEKEKSMRQSLRRPLMAGGILIVLLACGWIYLTGGRYIATDNAYIKAAKILVTPQVGGTITSVAVTDNQPVKKGDALFNIDPSSYEIAVAEAKADLANARSDIDQLKARYLQRKEDLARAQIDVDFTASEFDRRATLVKKGTVSQSEYNETRRTRDAAIKSLDAIQQDMKGILAALIDNPDIAPEEHPRYLKQMAVLNEAELNLERTAVIAPADGIIGVAPHSGDYARTGVPMLNLVGTDDIWIEANYKETELTDVRIGQPVTIEIDTYPGVEWHGHVESISPATGSEFSVLPAQNATGNWVKVVQRIAVRIAIDEGPADMPLRTGMSSHVVIDTGHYPHGINRKG